MAGVAAGQVPPVAANRGNEATNSVRAMLAEYAALQQQVAKAFETRDYEAAVAACRKVVALAPRQPDGHYNLGCALARLGRTNEALQALEGAAQRGFMDSEHMAADADLASLREQSAFQGLLRRMREQEQVSFNGTPIPGVRTLTGLPQGGLRYRLRLGEGATRERPHRLVVWLHPSGGSANEVVERMVPMLARRGYALAVFTQKHFMYWSQGDGERLMVTLEALRAVDGLNAERPILFGYSAGGQMALQMYRQTPERFGGLILDAAYPIDAARSEPGRMASLVLPQSESLRKTPWFAVVGDQDRGLAVWKDVETAYRTEAGVPLTLRVVTGRGHAWLFDERETAALEEWLTALAAGGMPGARGAPSAGVESVSSDAGRTPRAATNAP
jgi:predicted esterase